MELGAVDPVDLKDMRAEDFESVDMKKLEVNRLTAAAAEALSAASDDVTGDAFWEAQRERAHSPHSPAPVPIALACDSTDLGCVARQRLG